MDKNHKFVTEALKNFTPKQQLKIMMARMMPAHKAANTICTPFLDLRIQYYMPMEAIAKKIGTKNYDTQGAITFKAASLRTFMNDGITLQDIHKAAMNNMRDLELNIMDGNGLANYILQIEPEEQNETHITAMRNEPDHMFVLTYKDLAASGAMLMTRTDIMQTIADKLQNDLYLLPSSRHEIIATPVPEKEKATHLLRLQDMVRTINRTEVSEGDLLGESIYMFSRKSNELSIALPEGTL